MCSAWQRARLPTRDGQFTVHVYRESPSGHEHIVMIMGDLTGEAVLTRVHSECLTGDVLCSTRCDCGAQLARAQARIGREGRGVLIYMRGQEGRGIGLTAKLRAYALQDNGADTVDANRMLGLPVDARSFDAAARILQDLGVRSIRLMTNNPAKVAALGRLGVKIETRVPIEVPPTPDSSAYLLAKRDRLEHMLRQGARHVEAHPMLTQSLSLVRCSKEPG